MRTQWQVVVLWEKVVTDEGKVVSCEHQESELIALCQSEGTAEEIFRQWQEDAEDSYLNEFECSECLEDVTKCTCDKSDT